MTQDTKCDRLDIVADVLTVSSILVITGFLISTRIVERKVWGGYLWIPEIAAITGVLGVFIYIYLIYKIYNYIQTHEEEKEPSHQ
jgi:hypothetical protein